MIHRLLPYISKRLSFFILIFISLFLILFVIKQKRWKDRIINYDTAHYYGYLPSAFIYKDLTLNFSGRDSVYLYNKIFYCKTNDNKKAFKVSMGVAECYLPGFLLAHAYTLSVGGEATGFSTPYKVALVITGLIFSIIGLIYLRKLLRIWFDEMITSLVMLVIMIGTNLYTYVTFEGTMSHIYSFTMITAFVYYTVRWYKNPSFSYSLILGVLIGWIFLIRPTNLLVVAIFICWGIFSFKDVKARLFLFMQHWKKLFLLIVCSFLFIVPQILYWKLFTGSFFFYSYVGERFFFSNPHILEGLFSWRKGWLLYTPVMVLGIVGIFTLPKRIPELKFIFPIFLVVLLYITWSWWCWWYGGGFGQRSLTDWYGLIALSMACLIYWTKTKKVLFSIVVSFSIFCILFNQFQHRQFLNTSLHHDSMTREAYFYKFWSINKHPKIDSMLKAPDYEKAMKGEEEYYWE